MKNQSNHQMMLLKFWQMKYEVMQTEAVEEDTPSLDIEYAGFEADPEFSRFNEMVLKTFSGN